MKILICLACALCLVGCATNYQKKGWFGGGYREMKLGDNVYSVEYTSNSQTPPSLNEEHGLHRAAELSIEKGYRYFVISNSINTSRAYTMPITQNTRVNMHTNTHGNYGYGSYNSSSNGYANASTMVSGGGTFFTPGIQFIIIMSNNKTDNSFDARAILSNYDNLPPSLKDKLKKALS